MAPGHDRLVELIRSMAFSSLYIPPQLPSGLPSAIMPQGPISGPIGTYDIAKFEEMEILATLISGVAYGIVLNLACTIIYFLLRDRRQKQDSRRRYYILIVYIVAMVTLSTYSLVAEAIALVQHVARGILPKKFVALSPLGVSLVCLPLAIWGADGFMVSVHFHGRLHRV